MKAPGFGKRAVDQLLGHTVVDDDAETDGFRRLAPLHRDRFQSSRRAGEVGGKVNHGDNGASPSVLMLIKDESHWSSPYQPSRPYHTTHGAGYAGSVPLADRNCKSIFALRLVSGPPVGHRRACCVKASATSAYRSTLAPKSANRASCVWPATKRA